jgi:hypothetical protein
LAVKRHPTALAKAQIELTNPEKSLISTVEPQGGEGSARQFRYAPQSHADRSRTVLRLRMPAA